MWVLGVWWVGLALTAWLTLTLHDYQNERLQSRFNTEVDRIADDIERRFNLPLYGLIGAKGVYGASATVNRSEFRRYVASRNLSQEFPGLRGLGFIERVPRAELDAFLVRERADGAPDFSVRTQGNADDLYIIKFIEPLARNQAAQGLDVGAEPVRREAAERAASTGLPALSGVIQLVQDNLSRPGFLLYVPVYQPGLPLDTPEQRLAALYGLTYAPIVLEELLQPGLDLYLASDLHLHLSDKPESAGGQALFSVGSEHPKKVRLQTERATVISGLPLFLKVHSTPVFEATANYWLVLALGGAGALLSTLLALVLWLQATGRRETLQNLQNAMRENQALMSAIDQGTIYSVADLQGCVLDINHEFIRISGYTREELIGANHRILKSGLQPEGFWQDAWATISTGQVWRGEVCNRAKDGSLYWVDSTIVPFIGADGLVEKYISIRTDITAQKAAQFQIDAQHKRLDNIIKGTNVGTWEWHVPTGQTIFNERWAEIIGHTLAELEPVSIETWMRVAHQDDLKASGDALQRHFSGELDYYEVESRMRHKDGHWVWVLDRGQLATREADGQPGWMFGTHQDITAQKYAEAALRLSEGRMKALSELSAHWFWSTDAESRFTQFTCGDPDVLQVLNAAGLGRRRWELGVEPLSTTWAEHRAQIARREAFHDFEYRRVDPSGHEHYWSVSGTPWCNDEGEFVGYIGTGSDISERKSAELRLARSEALLERTAQIAKVGAWRVDLKTGLPEWSAETCRIHDVAVGYQPTMEQALNFYAPEARPIITELVNKGLQSGEGWDVELPFITATERRIWVRALGQVEMVNGRPVALLGAFQDITHQKMQADALLAAKTQAEQASLFKSQFLANMSHEIRTPMNAILGMLQLLQSTPLQPRQLDYVDKTEGAAKSLLGLLNDILDFSKVEAGKMTLDSQPFGLDKLLRDLSVIFSASVGNKPVEVLFDIDPQVPRQLVGDSLRLQQVLINLGGNAIKFTSQGEVVLRVRLEAMEGHGPEQRARVSFALQDSGIGIAPENQHRIFTGFTQAEASTTRRFGGTGLGLSICRRLVELMGGELRLQSSMGQGSTFSFSLSLSVGEQSAAFAPQCTQGLAVLVVDDNLLARGLMAAMGASMGWTVEVAGSGESALAMIRARAARGAPYRAVFVDWLMPGLDGWQTSARIREFEAGSVEGSAAPLIMMVTAHGREMLAQQTTEVQALIDGYLVKPVTASMLFDAMQNVLQPGSAAPTARVNSQVLRPLDGLRVLLVEDNAINQQVAEELLGAQGAAVDIADNGLRGVEAVQAAITSGKPYHAVLMDMQMPVMDGLTATREIRSRLGVADLPIIAMTANAMDSDREACLEAGMNDHVGKPFDLERLIATLLQWTKGDVDPIGATPALTQGLTDAPAPPASAVLNRAAALHRVGGSASLLNRLSTQFLSDLPGLLQACEAALDPSRNDKAQRALHTLKGVAATIGAEALADAARQAEHLCKDGNAVDLGHLHTVAAQTRQSLLDQGVAPPAGAGITVPVALPPMTQAQRDILERLLPLLEGSEMAVFDTMGELLAQGDSPRWVLLDGAVQGMDFGQAADWVRQALRPG